MDRGSLEPPVVILTRADLRVKPGMNNFRAAVPNPLSYTNSSPHATPLPYLGQHESGFLSPMTETFLILNGWVMSGLAQSGNGQTAVSGECK